MKKSLQGKFGWIVIYLVDSVIHLSTMGFAGMKIIRIPLILPGLPCLLNCAWPLSLSDASIFFFFSRRYWLFSYTINSRLNKVVYVCSACEGENVKDTRAFTTMGAYYRSIIRMNFFRSIYCPGLFERCIILSTRPQLFKGWIMLLTGFIRWIALSSFGTTRPR